MYTYSDKHLIEFPLLGYNKNQFAKKTTFLTIKRMTIRTSGNIQKIIIKPN